MFFEEEIMLLTTLVSHFRVFPIAVMIGHGVTSSITKSHQDQQHMPERSHRAEVADPQAVDRYQSTVC